MKLSSVVDSLIEKNESKIVFLIFDGLGGLPMEGGRGTELQVAKKPRLDELAARSICGLLDPLSPGLTPGSGPAHFALFGYDPFEYNIGRGILEAAGIDFPITDRDVLARINYATIDKNGVIVDRRAGRIDTKENERICKKLQENIRLSNVEIMVEPVKEHRAVLVIRGDNLHGDIEDTDPQREGHAPLKPRAMNQESEATARLVEDFIKKAQEVLSDEKKANALLLRGFSKHRGYPSMKERYGLNAFSIATYPMYRGITRLLGFTVCTEAATIEDEFKALKENYAKYDFFYLHIKHTDSRGEDGDFDGKVEVIEKVDKLIPSVTSLNPDVLVVTGDHSTPAKLKAHSWHPLPVLLSSSYCRPDEVKTFDEISCIHGGLGRMLTVHLMTVALSNAGRLAKFGA